MQSVSALTIAAGRAEHLRNVIRGFRTQTQAPVELIVAVMQGAPYDDLPETDFPVRQILVPPVEGELPLSAARNRAAEAAMGDVLAFVDVDCIPNPSLIADYATAAEPGRGLIMGEVLYLREGATSGGLDFDLFDKIGVRHSDRAGPPQEGLRRCEDYRCFWSLNFAMNRADWDRSGGFDEGYVGYGGEDTDFGRVLDDRNIPIWWMKGARVYHQYHAHCMPPIHQVASVIRNAEYFASRWGHRTMEHWLHGFRMLGLIENTRTGLRILREPTEADFALCRQEPDMPYANTRRVLDKLEEIDAASRSGRDREAQVALAQADLIGIAAQ
ncbi:glycosyltransferase family 2 protein [Tropicimonas isoalkanivorans]|uniref:Glycosyltransferase, GT2 family n=1 Tax=Tropicimonas isoalkanivorans TaxID=441112 RepID=A0A1I1HB01_9RHOB|nr:galactosyltransferase-related protein [Tropicimonas isoalkanivorans]SFC21329.1 Glycosyltransferase, GT2 family [Tropicimonas isoalkanivorans]